MEETVFLSVDRFMDIDNPGMFMNGEHSRRLLSHTHSAYLKLVVCSLKIYLAIKHLESKRTQLSTCSLHVCIIQDAELPY